MNLPRPHHLREEEEGVNRPLDDGEDLLPLDLQTHSNFLVCLNNLIKSCGCN